MYTTGLPISSMIWRYCLLCGGVAIGSGYLALIGALAEDFSQQVIRNISIVLGVMGVLALLSGIPVMFVAGMVQRKSQGAITKAGTRVAADVVVFVCAFVLLLVLYGICIAVLQLSTVQFLFGDEEVQYRHLIILSAYAGTMFGVYGGWKGRVSHGLSLTTSFWHAARVFLETAFLAYAGMWLFKDPFGYALKQAEAANWEVVAIAALGMALICGGSLSLMARQSQAWPQEAESTEPILVRFKVSQWIQNAKGAREVIWDGLGKFASLFRR